MKKLLKLIFVASSVFILPVVTFAQVTTSSSQVTVSSAAVATCNNSGLGLLLCQIHQLLNGIVPVLISLGIVYFVWGVVQYVIAGGEEAKTKGRDRVIYGIIGLTVIVGVWGLVGLIVTTFGLSATVNIPSVVTTSTAASSGASCTLVDNPNFQNLLGYGTCIINNSLIPFMFALAIIYFIWGIVQFISSGSEEAKRTQGKAHMIWGIIALTVMLGVWSLVGILGGTFGIDNVLPQVSPSSSP